MERLGGEPGESKKAGVSARGRAAVAATWRTMADQRSVGAAAPVGPPVTERWDCRLGRESPAFQEHPDLRPYLHRSEPVPPVEG